MKDNETINLIKGLRVKLNNLIALEKTYLDLGKQVGYDALELRKTIGKLEACCGGSCECS